MSDDTMFQGQLLSEELATPIPNPVGWLPYGVLQPFIGNPYPLWVISLVVALIPVSVLVAVLRYRLFELDRIVSRTVTYTLVSAVLIALYVVIAVVPSAVFELRSDVLVAIATLAVAGAFVPVRHQAQTVVDRHFNRASYDAAVVADGFAERLRHQLDLTTLQHDISRTVVATMQPAHLTVWLTRRGDP